MPVSPPFAQQQEITFGDILVASLVRLRRPSRRRHGYSGVDHLPTITTGRSRASLVLVTSLSLIAATVAIGTTSASAEGSPVFATVSGHEPFSSDANKVGYWCGELGGTKVSPGGSSYVLPDGTYSQVIVKAGSGSTRTPSSRHRPWPGRRSGPTRTATTRTTRAAWRRQGHLTRHPVQRSPRDARNHRTDGGQGLGVPRRKA